MTAIQDYKIAKLQELKEKKGFLVRVWGEEISVFKIAGELFAIANVCSHQHFSKLHEGEVSDCTVTCPMHGWTYDLRTGISTNGNGRVRTYPVIIRNDDVFIQKHGNTH